MDHQYMNQNDDGMCLIEHYYESNKASTDHITSLYNDCWFNGFRIHVHF